MSSNASVDRIDTARWQRRSPLGGNRRLERLGPGRVLQPRAVIPRLPGGLPVLFGHRAGFDGVVDGLSPDGRKLGIPDSPHPGSRDEDPSAPGRALPADRMWDPLSLPLGTARRGGRQSATPIPAVLPRPHLVLDSRRGLFRRLAGDGLPAGILVAQGRRDGPGCRELRGWPGRAGNSAHSARSPMGSASTLQRSTGACRCSRCFIRRSGGRCSPRGNCSPPWLSP